MMSRGFPFGAAGLTGIRLSCRWERISSRFVRECVSFLFPVQVHAESCTLYPVLQRSCTYLNHRTLYPSSQVIVRNCFNPILRYRCRAHRFLTARTLPLPVEQVGLDRVRDKLVKTKRTREGGQLFRLMPSACVSFVLCKLQSRPRDEPIDHVTRTSPC